MMALEIRPVRAVGAWLGEMLPGYVSPPVLLAPGDDDVLEATPRELGPVRVPELPGLDGPGAGVRPMGCVRSPGELVAASMTVATREVNDARYGYLRRGVQAAADWVLGFVDSSPVRGEQTPRPSLVDIVEEYALAVVVAAGARAFPGRGWSDAARIAAHGSELFLLWYGFVDVPTPAVLRGDASFREVFDDLADVGCDAPGLHGPQVSRLRFDPVPGARFAATGDGALVIS